MDWNTHQVFNQVPALEDVNLFALDPVLQAAVAAAGADWHREALHRYGARLGAAQTLAWAEAANRHPPRLETHDRWGNRVDRVEFDPAWAELMGLLYGEGVHCLPWSDPRPGAQAARAAAFYLHGQVEAGSLCPTTMTFAAIPLLWREPALFAGLHDKLFSRRFDPRDHPLADKHSATLGMGLTEKQGGSDLRNTATTARPLRAEGRGEAYALVGHKWFFSAPTSDAHLVLAKSPEGLSCFFVPRWREDGTLNRVRIQRLKDKLGNRSNASAEVEFQDAHGILVGEPGRGIATLIEMASHTRLDCVLGSAALLRRGLLEALHHARHRSAFGRPLSEQPLMRTVLADLALESEAAIRLALRLATAYERTAADPGDLYERALWRILTPAAKFWVCKRTVAVVAEAMEVLGGNGYVESAPLARLLREAPVNSIWEGAGNVMCLDVLRGLAREPEAKAVLLDTLLDRTADDGCLAAAARRLADALRQPPGELEPRARWLAQHLVLLLQALILMDAGEDAAAHAFIQSRLAEAGGAMGAGPGLTPAANTAILARAMPPQD